MLTRCNEHGGAIEDNAHRLAQLERFSKRMQFLLHNSQDSIVVGCSTRQEYFAIVESNILALVNKFLHGTLEVSTLSKSQQLVATRTDDVECIARPKSDASGTTEATTLSSNAELLTTVCIECNDLVQVTACHKQVGVWTKHDVRGSTAFGKLCEDTKGLAHRIVLEDLIRPTGDIDVVVVPDLDSLRGLESSRTRWNECASEYTMVGIECMHTIVVNIRNKKCTVIGDFHVVADLGTS